MTINNRLILQTLLAILIGLTPVNTVAQAPNPPYLEANGVYVETTDLVIEPTLKERGQQIADEYGVPFYIMDRIIENESNWGKRRIGDNGDAQGLAHINKRWFPEEFEKAVDDEFSLRFVAQEIKDGKEWQHSICSCIAWLRIKGVKFPRVRTAQDLVTNSNVPSVGGIIKLKYGTTYHLAYIEKLTQEGIEISENNYQRCLHTERVIPWGSDNIVGYYYVVE